MDDLALMGGKEILIFSVEFNLTFILSWLDLDFLARMDKLVFLVYLALK